MDKMRDSPAEVLKRQEIKAVEMKELDRVFEWLVEQGDPDHKDKRPEDQSKAKITLNGLAKAL
jgi:hypothetical protein